MDNPQDRNNAPAAAGNLPPAQEPAHGLFSIWEDDMVKKFVDDKGKPNGSVFGATRPSVPGVPQKHSIMCQKWLVKMFGRAP